MLQQKDRPMTKTLRFFSKLAAAFDRLPRHHDGKRLHSWYLSTNVY